MASRLQDVIQRGIRADQPLATDVANGTLYCVTDEGDIVERSNGTAWESYSPAASGGGITELTGPVTAGPGSGSQATTIAAGVVTPAMQTVESKTGSIIFTVNGGGSPVTVGLKGILRVPVAVTITRWSVMADVAGDIEFDLLSDAPGTTYPPTTSIVASDPPRLTGGTNDFADGTGLTGWTTVITALNCIQCEIVSTSGTIGNVTLQLDYVRN